jgi:hypothetical protein
MRQAIYSEMISQRRENNLIKINRILVIVLHGSFHGTHPPEFVRSYQGNKEFHIEIGRTKAD